MVEIVQNTKLKTDSFSPLAFQLFQKISCKRVHSGEGEPLFAQVFEGSTEMIELGLVDDYKAVVGFGELFYFYWRILFVMLFKI
jgi:hypothetical protein